MTTQWPVVSPNEVMTEHDRDYLLSVVQRLHANYYALDRAIIHTVILDAQVAVMRQRDAMLTAVHTYLVRDLNVSAASADELISAWSDEQLAAYIEVHGIA